MLHASTFLNQAAKSLGSITRKTRKKLSSKEWSDIGSKRGIYKILSLRNDCFYIGSTSNSFHYRFRAHMERLVKGNHGNPKLQACWNKYGADSFEFVIIAIIDDDKNILKTEQDMLTKHFGHPKFLNISLDATAPMKGRKHSAETLAKMSVASKRNGKKIGELTRKRQLGTKHSPATIAKMKTSAQNRDDSNRLKAITSEACREKHRKWVISDSQRRNMSRGQLKRDFILVKDGLSIDPISVRGFCRDNNLERKNMQQLIRGGIPVYKGWKIKKTLDTVTILK